MKPKSVLKIRGRGESNACIFSSAGAEAIHLREVSREEMLRLFFFVDTLAMLPEEGMRGFDLSASDPRICLFLFYLWRTFETGLWLILAREEERRPDSLCSGDAGVYLTYAREQSEKVSNIISALQM